VDLKSNSRGRARARWTASCTRRTSPRWTGHITRRGTRSCPSARDPTVQILCTQTRRRLACVVPGQSSRPPIRPRAGALHSRNTRARDRGGPRGRSCLVGGRHWKGSARPLRRACERAKVHKKKGILVGVIAHCAKERQASTKAKGMRQRGSLATVAVRAALRCGRGTTLTCAGDEIRR
jgi:hypothetical protein